MHVMSVRDFLKVPKLEPHEVCVAQGTVYPLPEGGRVLFASHQWLSGDHPDPDSVQLRALQTMVGTIVDQYGSRDGVDAILVRTRVSLSAYGTAPRTTPPRALPRETPRLLHLAPPSLQPAPFLRISTRKIPTIVVTTNSAAIAMGCS